MQAMRALPRKQQEDSLRTLLRARQTETRTAARKYRELLYGISLLLVALLVHFAIQLSARAKALQRRAAFEHTLAAISMRFINAQPQTIGIEIERALADMALGLGADRAYFVLSGSEPRLHGWAGAGSDFPPGWPENALGVAARSDRSADGMIRSVKPSVPVVRMSRAASRSPVIAAR